MILKNETIAKIMRCGGLVKLSKNTKIPVRSRWEFAKLLNELKPLIDNYNKELKKILEKYCKKDEQGKVIVNNNNYEIPEDKMPEYLQEVNDLNNLENKLNYEKQDLNVNDLEDFSTEDFFTLTEIINFKEQNGNS